MAFLSRINRLHIAAAAGVIFVALLAAFWFSFLQPTLKQIADTEAKQAEQEKTWAKLPAKVAALSLAQANLATMKTQAEAFVNSMPQFSADPFEAMFDLHREFTTGTGPALVGFFLSKGYPASGIQVPAPPLQPTALPPVLTLPMQNFAVTARSFPAVLTLLRELKEMPRLGVISGVTLSGTSPELRVAMPLTIYIVTQQALNPAAAAADPAAAPGIPGARGAPGAPAIKFGFGRRR
jgi:hypothetical protein